MYQPAYGPPRSRPDQGRMPGLYSRGFRDDFRERDLGFEAADFNVPGAPPQNHGRHEAYDYRAAHTDPWGLRRERPLLAPNLYSEPRFPPPRVPEHEPRRYRDAEYLGDLYSQPHFPPPRVAMEHEPRRYHDAEYRDLYSDPRRQGPWNQGLREPWNEGIPSESLGASATGSQHFGARAWGDRWGDGPRRFHPPDDHFEPPVPRYGLRAPEGLSVPGFDLPRHQLPSEIYRAKEAGFGREDFVASESHMPPLPSVPKEVPKEEGRGNHLDLPEVIVMGDGPVSEPVPSRGADQAPGGTTTAMSELRACEAQLELAASELHLTQQALKLAEVTPGQARADLAQLEARLDRLQCHSIDAVSTAGLSSQDEDAARNLRRQLVKQVEQLQRRLDETFERLKGQ
eukprot:s13_g43.t2